MPDTKPPSRWLEHATDRGLEAFFDAYLQHFDALNDAVLEIAMQDPGFAAVVESMTPAALVEQRAEGLKRLREALAGQWKQYDAHLIQQGRHYALMGIPLRAWTRMLEPLGRLLRPALIDRLADDPTLLNEALGALDAFTRRVTTRLSEAYIQTKQDRQREAAKLREMSARLKAENERIQTASRLKSEFLANMSHELRTPLNAIIGFSELLYDGGVPPDAPEHREFLGSVLEASRHLLQLINDILDLSKVEAGKLEFYPEPTSIPMIVGATRSILRTVAAQKRVTLDATVDPSLEEFCVDPARLKQVVYNYLSNAIKFSDPGESVTIRASRTPAGALRIEVEDRGVGIAEKDIGRLFQEFQQLDAGASKGQQGTGLGLSLTRRLVEAQGGTVGVRSELGQGSTFHAIIPEQHTSGALPAPRHWHADTTETRPRVLVVEDDPVDQELIGSILFEAGYSVDAVATGAQAIEMSSRTAYNAITLDLILPDGTGLDVLASLRRAGPNAATPVVVLTIVGEHGAVGAFAIQDVLPKPVDADRLLAAVGLPDPGSDASGTILIVDDDPAALSMMSSALTRAGHENRTFLDPTEALAISQRQPPSAVVLDLVMPTMSGFSFLRHFRALPGCGGVPVLVWTAHELDDGERRELLETAQRIVQKGVAGPLEVSRVLATFVQPSDEESSR